MIFVWQLWKSKEGKQWTFTKWFLFGILIAVGCFVRITFVLFAFSPSLFILLSDYQKKPLKQLIIDLFGFLIGFLMTCLSIITLDSFLYYRLNHHFEWIIAPYRNLLYNSNKQNLLEHGLHPFYFHFIYAFLLFHALLLKNIFFKVKLNICLQLGFWIPLLGLCMIPHQEPRFLLPLFLPLVLQSLRLKEPRKHLKYWKLLKRILLPLVVISVLFLSFLHQNGAYHALDDFQTSLPVYSWKMFPVPLFQIPHLKYQPLKELKQMNASCYLLLPNWSLIEMKSERIGQFTKECQPCSIEMHFVKDAGFHIGYDDLLLIPEAYQQFNWIAFRLSLWKIQIKNNL